MRLPGNLRTIRFIGARLAAKFRRLVYGLTVEKNWRVARARTVDDSSPLAALRSLADGRWDVPSLPPGASFLADGFFAPDGTALAEAMDSATRRGRLVRVDDDGSTVLTEAGQHWSYPYPFDQYVVPETAEWSSPAAYRLTPAGLDKAFHLDLGRPERLIDPSLLSHNGQIYLFANRLEESSACLRLWVAPSLDARFIEHPSSPIRLSDRGSRMGGRVFRWRDGLFRLGQDWRQNYGDGLVAFRIDRLDPSHYAETHVGDFAFAHVHGPHTLDARGDMLLFDYYEERFSWLAGWRRLRARLRSSTCA